MKMDEEEKENRAIRRENSRKGGRDNNKGEGRQRD